jgi:elongation factor G
MMKVEVVVPEEYTGSVVGDLSSRRGIIQGMTNRVDGSAVVTSNVPLSEMFGYATNLRGFTQGRGSFTMEFAQYTIAPTSIAEEVISGKR